jgi:hypothetical protein
MSDEPREPTIAEIGQAVRELGDHAISAIETWQQKTLELEEQIHRLVEEVLRLQGEARSGAVGRG